LKRNNLQIIPFSIEGDAGERRAGFLLVMISRSCSNSGVSLPISVNTKLLLVELGEGSRDICNLGGRYRF